jgi:probable rRNA maturation factor
MEMLPPPVTNNSMSSEARGASRHDCLVLNRQRMHAVNSGAIRYFLSELAVYQKMAAASLSVVLISDRAMQTYNRKYRGKDKPTDVLSFRSEGEYLGDILISVETAFQQARKSPSLTLETNIRRLALHGFLHLSGYDHETDNGEMRAIERRLRRRFKC